MKQKISGPVGAAIVLVALVVIVGILWRVYFYKPTLSPAEVSQGLAAGFKKTQDYYRTHPGATGAPTNVPGNISGAAGAPSGQGK
ncbi:MAG TPA: hypothetical protein VKT32_08560 [Chthonomonadaceae bacterium]|nr:hypothetical protein [Chthonomonadaceae bacterium]